MKELKLEVIKYMGEKKEGNGSGLLTRKYVFHLLFIQ